MLAAVTPRNYDIEIVDERVQENNLDDNPDIVGISFECYRQRRAFELADHYRKKGAKVIFGGVHTTACYKEVQAYCDAAVIGEAEELWPKVLQDFENGQLKKIYAQNTPVDLSRLPLPRMDLIDTRRYTFVYPIQASRGCIHNCGFCFSKTINPTYRTFPVDYVYEQAKIAGDTLFFLDDNFTADRNNAIKVLKRLAPLKKSIAFQANLYIGKDLELLKVMQEAGVKLIFAGIESINEESLKSVHKGFNKVMEYEECIKNLKAHDVEPTLGIIFGLDHDRKDIFKTTLDFLQRNDIVRIAPNLIVPYPGTMQYERYENEKRIMHNTFSLYHGRYLIVKPKGMSVKELEEGYAWFIRKYYSPLPFIRRSLKNRRHLGRLIGLFYTLAEYHVLKITSLFARKECRF